MKQYNNAMRKISSVILPVLFLLAFNTGFAQGDAEAGKSLFKNNCASCHSTKLEKDATGPALEGLLERRDKEWAKKWIKNNAALIASGDPVAKEMEGWSGSVMTTFDHLTDQNLEDIVAFIDGYCSTCATDEGGSKLIKCEVAEEQSDSNWVTWVGVIILSLLVIAIFTGINRSLRNAAAARDGQEEKEPLAFYEAIKAFASERKVAFGLIVFLILGAVTTIGWDFAMHVGVYGGKGNEKTMDYENYKPEQPIAFRHDIHVLQNEIDCKYCHSGALDSRHALIPSANVCMNCHKSVNEGHCSGNNEIKKIYEAVNFVYGKGYFKVVNGEVEKNGNDTVFYETQQEGGKPIEWIKVHNLPDFVYFNHSQHVVVGGVECLDCHTGLDTMTVAEHSAPLTMGWCVNCHRETKVNEKLNMSGKPNGYYEKMHAQFEESYKHEDKFDFTVDKIGGLECAKCHY